MMSSESDVVVSSLKENNNSSNNNNSISRIFPDIILIKIIRNAYFLSMYDSTSLEYDRSWCLSLRLINHMFIKIFKQLNNKLFFNEKLFSALDRNNHLNRINNSNNNSNSNSNSNSKSSNSNILNILFERIESLEFSYNAIGKRVGIDLIGDHLIMNSLTSLYNCSNIHLDRTTNDDDDEDYNVNDSEPQPMVTTPIASILTKSNNIVSIQTNSNLTIDVQSKLEDKVYDYLAFNNVENLVFMIVYKETFAYISKIIKHNTQSKSVKLILTDEIEEDSLDYLIDALQTLEESNTPKREEI
ncbi:hypothetical protein PPL_03441 [Heterostelium album PN500]|uniref:Uncharacterized protein n=1 Tax=Heterostelium pallidum (strain ATCC 26659 / Pp 5 / PN500) TaxID=670386 RepID=D3B4W5_HETP5|nr:hypothetical protein PPL_03441 [Heterostelium album PN500]EFA84363.1 hypothetical protein PPL_03441 [Heterostelium album PN500]|eukprot:XP_020436478.1 hypothetical protein PPL_03441 [Heterostelium album PN500]